MAKDRDQQEREAAVPKAKVPDNIKMPPKFRYGLKTPEEMRQEMMDTWYEDQTLP